MRRVKLLPRRRRSTTVASAAIHNFAEKFAQQHGLALPFVVDPQKKLAAEVQADMI